MQGRYAAKSWHGCPIGAYGSLRKMQAVKAIPPGLCASDSEKPSIDKRKPLSMFAVQANKERQLCARARWSTSSEKPDATGGRLRGGDAHM